MKRPSARKWLGLSRFWDVLCALCEGSRSGLKHVFRIPDFALDGPPRFKPRKKKPSFWPTFEALERREVFATGFNEYALGASANPFVITPGPDSNTWYTAQSANKIGKVTTTGTATEYTVPTGSSSPWGIVKGPDGLLWFTENAGNKIGKVTTTGSFTEYTIPTSSSSPKGITVGSDSNLWFVESATNKIAKVTTGGSFTEYTIGAATFTATEIISAPDGNLWFTGSDTNGDKIGKITTSGTVTLYAVTAGTPYALAMGADGNIWYTSGSNVVRCTLDGTTTTMGTVTGTGHGITLGSDNNIWVAETSGVLARITPAGTVTEYTPTGTSGEDVTVGSDGLLWFSEPTQNKAGRFSWILGGASLADDPVHDSRPVGQATVSLLTGNLSVVATLDGEDGDGDGCSCGCECGGAGGGVGTGAGFGSVGLVYNASTVSAQPMLNFYYYLNPSDPVLTTLQGRLKWNGGSWGDWVNFNVPEIPPSTVRVFLQVGSAVTSTGYYPWEVEVKADWGSGSITRNLTGNALVVANGSSDEFGQGWSVDGLDKLVTVNSTDILWVYGGGGSRFFDSLGSGAFLSPAQDFGTLVKNQDDSFTYTAKNQDKWYFDSGGALSKVVDAAGLTTTYVYSSGRLSTRTSPTGEIATFTYDGSNKLASVALPGSRTVTVTVDGSGNLTKFSMPDGNLRTFTYDANHRLTNQKWDLVNTTYVYDSSNFTLATVTFDSSTSYGVSPASEDTVGGSIGAGPTVYMIDGGGGNSAGVAHWTNAAGVSEDYTFNDIGRITASKAGAAVGVTTITRDFASQPSKITDPLAHVTTYSYLYGSSKGDLSTITKPDGTTLQFQYDSTFHKPTVRIDAAGLRTTQSYNATTGLLETTQDPTGNIVTYSYNAAHLLESRLDPVGTRSTFLYDGNNRLQTSVDYLGNRVTYGYDSAGNLQTVTDVYGHTATYAYDGMRHQTSSVDIYGNRTTSTFNGQGQLTSQLDPYTNRSTWVYDSAGRQTVGIDAYGSRSTFVYDTSGRLSATVDQFNNRTTYSYDTANQRTGVLDAYTNRTTTVYDSSGHVSATIDPYAQRTTTIYDSYGRYSATVDPFLNRTTQTYDAYGRRETSVDMYASRTTTVYDSYGRVEATVDSYSSRSTTVYDSYNRFSASIDSFGNRATVLYDTYGRSETSIDMYAQRTTTVYDSYNRVSATVDPYANRTTTLYDSYGRSETDIDYLGNRATTVYDSNGRYSASIDVLGNRATTIYDSNGRYSASVDTSGNRSTSTYDSLGRQETTIDALGNRTTAVYDTNGRYSATIDALAGRTTTIYDTNGRYSATIDALGNRATTVYDTSGRVSATLDGLGNRTTTIYDSNGRYSATIDPVAHRDTVIYDTYGRTSATVNSRNNRTTYLYDSRGREETVQNALGERTTTVFDSQGRYSATVDGLGNRTTTIYDATYGRYSATVDALGNRTTALYDSYGRQETSVDQLGNRTTTIYDSYGRYSASVDPLANRSTTVYDSVGREVATVNGLGYRTTVVFDELNRQTVSIDQLAGRTTTVYDALGNIVNIIDANANKTTFVYDALSRKTTETDPLGKSATFAYNAAGYMTSTTDRLGRRRDFTYDGAGFKTGETWKNADTTTANVLTFTFDNEENNLTGFDYDGVTTLTYDALDRVSTSKDMWGILLTFSYDAAGNRTKVVDSAGGTSTYVYNALHQLTQRQFGGVAQTAARIDLTYTAAGNVETTVRFSDLAGTTEILRSTYTYNAVGNITNLVHKAGSTNIANYTYVYDNHGRLTSEQTNGTTVTYTYDNSDQLTGDGTTTVTYDANGNRNNGSYTVGTANRLTSDGTWNYTYDDEGNETKKVNIGSGLTWTYTYDHKNQMTMAQRKTTDGGTLEFQVAWKYDAWGNRIQKDVDNDGNLSTDVTQRYSYDGWKTPQKAFVGMENWDVLLDLDGSNNVTTRYIRGDAIDQVFARQDSGTQYWYLNDRLGSIRDVTDNSGVVKDTLTYGGFGNIATESNSTFRGRYAWTSRDVDTETSLQYNRARYYDPAIGRWTSRDPLGFDAGDGNLYRYVRNSALIETDPSGCQVPELFSERTTILNLLGQGRTPFTAGWRFLTDYKFDPPIASKCMFLQLVTVSDTAINYAGEINHTSADTKVRRPIYVLDFAELQKGVKTLSQAGSLDISSSRRQIPDPVLSKATGLAETTSTLFTPLRKDYVLWYRKVNKLHGFAKPKFSPPGKSGQEITKTQYDNILKTGFDGEPEEYSYEFLYINFKMNAKYGTMEALKKSLIANDEPKATVDRILALVSMTGEDLTKKRQIALLYSAVLKFGLGLKDNNHGDDGLLFYAE